MNNYRITNVADAISNLDAVNVEQLNAKFNITNSAILAEQTRAETAESGLQT